MVEVVVAVLVVVAVGIVALGVFVVNKKYY